MLANQGETLTVTDVLCQRNGPKSWTATYDFYVFGDLVTGERVGVGYDYFPLRGKPYIALDEDVCTAPNYPGFKSPSALAKFCTPA